MLSGKISRTKMGIYLLLVLLLLPLLLYIYIVMILFLLCLHFLEQLEKITSCSAFGDMIVASIDSAIRILQKSKTIVLSLFIWSFLGLKNTWMKLQPFRSWDEKQSIPPFGSPHRNFGQDRSCVSFHVTQKGQACKQ